MQNIYITIYSFVVIILSLRNTERNLSKKDIEYSESPVHYSDVFCSWIESGYGSTKDSEISGQNTKEMAIISDISFFWP